MDPPRTMEDDSEGGGSAPVSSSSSSSSRARRGRGRGLTFINAAHPADALSRHALSSIRAHVARDAHARGRRGRTRAAVLRAEPGKSGRPSPPPSGGRAQQASEPPSEYGAEASGAAAAAAGAGGVEQEEPGAGLAPLVAAEELATAASAMWREAEVVQSLAALNTRLGAMAWSWDPFRSFVRPVSDTEAFLIDHYVNYAIRYDRVCCQNADRALRVVLRSAWVPFALSDEGALAALLMQACRSVLWLLPRRRRRAAQGPEAASWAGATTTAPPPPPPAATPAAAEAYYSRLMLIYKGLCIRSVNVSLSREWPHVSDATIAKSMIMGTEERIAGNMDGWLAHSFAVSRMAEQRGGPSRLGISGFLARGAGHCIAATQGLSEQRANLSMRPSRGLNW
ncbi:hypothetical protein RB593_009662, partial [Gaeumannomyces tritici]